MRKYFERLYGKKSTTKESQSNNPSKETAPSATNNEPAKCIHIPRLRNRTLSGSSNWSNKLQSLPKVRSSHEYNNSAIQVPSTVHPTTNMILPSEHVSASSDQPSYIESADHINNAHKQLKRVTTRVKDMAALYSLLNILHSLYCFWQSAYVRHIRNAILIFVTAPERYHDEHLPNQVCPAKDASMIMKRVIIFFMCMMSWEIPMAQKGK